MAKSDASSGGNGSLFEPVVVALRVIGRFFDVATLMVRLLYNTLVHNDPHGGQDAGSVTK